MMRARKAQAALEYLVTYGWGIVAILVIIGALSYFGLLSPTRYIPARCDFSTQMECTDYLLQGAQAGVDHGRVSLKFRNNFGDDITITDISTSAGPATITSATPINIVKGNVSLPIVVAIGQADTSTYLNTGDRQTVQLIVTFQRTSPVGPKHNVTGEIFATVQ